MRFEGGKKQMQTVEKETKRPYPSELEPMTKKQEKFLTYLVSKTVDYGRKLYITGVSNGNGSGDLVPVLLPNDYDFKVTYLEDLNKWEAMKLIEVLNKARRQENEEILKDVDETTAKKIQLDEQEITLHDYLQGQRVLLGIEID